MQWPRQQPYPCGCVSRGLAALPASLVLLPLLLLLPHQVCKLVIDAARAEGKRVVLVRHPMPYGDLAKQVGNVLRA